MTYEEAATRFERGTPVRAIVNGATGVVCFVDRNFTGAPSVLVRWDESGLSSYLSPYQIKPIETK